MTLDSDHNFAAVAAALDRFGAPLPDNVANATEIAWQASAARDKIYAETEPPINALTAGAITKSIDAIAVWRATRQHRLGAADTVRDHARAAELQARNSAAAALHTTFAELLDTAALRFTDALAHLDGETDMANNVGRGRGDLHQAASVAAADLTALRDARHALLGACPHEWDQPFHKWSGFLDASWSGAYHGLASAVKSRNLEPDPADGGLQWWAQLLAVPGVSLKWRTTGEQAALWATIPRHRNQPGPRADTAVAA